MKIKVILGLLLLTGINLKTAPVNVPTSLQDIQALLCPAHTSSFFYGIIAFGLGQVIWENKGKVIPGACKVASSIASNSYNIIKDNPGKLFLIGLASYFYFNSNNKQ